MLPVVEEEEKLPFNFEKFPPRPRQLDKIVESVDEFAEKIRNGKEVDLEETTTTEMSQVEENETTTTTTATTTVSTTTTSTTTTPNLAPEIRTNEEQSAVQPFTVGEPIVLVCKAANPPGVPQSVDITYSWTKNGRYLPEFDSKRGIYRESRNNGHLLFVSPDLSDIGTYQCGAENKFGKTFSKAILLMPKKTQEPATSEKSATSQSNIVLAASREPRKNDDVFLVFPEGSS